MPDVKFIPPQLNPWLARILQLFFPLAVSLGYKLQVKVDPVEVPRLKAIADQRVVYLPNHSNLDDGIALFILSARLGQLFNYVVALEAFRGWIAKLLQTMGAYSIRRGVGDRPSIVQTLKILQQPQCKLVIFPEGGCSYQNATVMPFRPGAFELSFKALAKLVNHNSDPNSVPDFYLVPLSLKYTYPDATEEDLDSALTRLETELSITPQQDVYERLRFISLQILTSLEKEYQVDVPPPTEIDYRIKLLKQEMLNYCETQLNLSPPKQLANRERVYRVQATLRSIDDSDKVASVNYQHLYLTTVRLLNFDAIYDGYVAENPTLERFFDTIDRLEREVFQCDRPKFKGRREIVIKIASPINLKDYWQEYQSEGQSSPDNLTNKQSVVERLTQLSQQLVQANLN
ncbi:MAG: 1-acyl-sn-glycerol-3-phosphate acyltransferase [Cyanobacteria bacterium J06621_8]